MLLVVLLVFVLGCGTTIETHSDGDDDHESGGEIHSGSVSTGEVKEFDMIAKQWEFEPSVIEVNLGDRVDIHVKSVDVAHGFNLPEFGVSERLEPGEVVHVEFVADKRGTFQFICHVPCGQGHSSMNGQLIVK